MNGEWGFIEEFRYTTIRALQDVMSLVQKLMKYLASAGASRDLDEVFEELKYGSVPDASHHHIWQGYPTFTRTRQKNNF